jgi:hypothetical protein
MEDSMKPLTHISIYAFLFCSLTLIALGLNNSVPYHHQPIINDTTTVVQRVSDPSLEQGMMIMNDRVRALENKPATTTQQFYAGNAYCLEEEHNNTIMFSCRRLP